MQKFYYLTTLFSKTLKNLFFNFTFWKYAFHPKSGWHLPCSQEITSTKLPQMLNIYQDLFWLVATWMARCLQLWKSWNMVDSNPLVIDWTSWYKLLDSKYHQHLLLYTRVKKTVTGQIKGERLLGKGQEQGELRRLVKGSRLGKQESWVLTYFRGKCSTIQKTLWFCNNWGNNKMQRRKKCMCVQRHGVAKGPMSHWNAQFRVMVRGGWWDEAIRMWWRRGKVSWDWVVRICPDFLPPTPPWSFPWLHGLRNTSSCEISSLHYPNLKVEREKRSHWYLIMWQTSF